MTLEYPALVLSPAHSVDMAEVAQLHQLKVPSVTVVKAYNCHKTNVEHARVVCYFMNNNMPAEFKMRTVLAS